MLNLQEYHRPSNLDEAIALLTRKSPKTVVLGGGTWLMGEGTLGHLRDVQAVVDVADLGLNQFETTLSVEMGQPNILRIGAAVTHEALAKHEITGTRSASALHPLGECAEAMSGLNIRNRATLAGAICTPDASSPLVTALLACEADLLVRDRNNKQKRLQLAGFLSYREAILNEGVLITEIRVPYPMAEASGVFVSVGRTPKDYPIVCVAAKLAIREDIGEVIRVAVGGVASTPIRLNDLEFGLEGRAVSKHVDEELDKALAELNPPSDYLGTREYRLNMARVLVKRALLAASG